MGEYIKLANGDEIKVGTCENLYYCTYDELQFWVDQGATKLQGNLPPADYLTNGFRYRFPFPNDPNPYDDYSKGIVVHVPPELLHNVEHQRICKGLHPAGGGYNINAFITCPMSPDADPGAYSIKPDSPIAEVVQQKAVDGSLWTVLRCAYCGAKWRLPPDEGYELAEYLTAWVNRTYHDGPNGTDDYSGYRQYFHAIADAITEGYERTI